eukprot:4761887-Amphidinium_carterae.1
MAQSTLKSWTLAGQAATAAKAKRQFAEVMSAADKKQFDALCKHIHNGDLPVGASGEMPIWWALGCANWSISSSTDGPQDLQVCVGDAAAVVEVTAEDAEGLSSEQRKKDNRPPRPRSEDVDFGPRGCPTEKVRLVDAQKPQSSWGSL